MIKCISITRKKAKKKSSRSRPACVAICWGFGFLGLRYVDGLPTFYVQAIRFGIAALALAAVFFKHLKNVDKELLKAGILIGILMFACYVCATLGIKYTTASRTAFFSTLGAICVPLLNFVIYRIRLTRKSALCVVICVVGVYLIRWWQCLPWL